MNINIYIEDDLGSALNTYSKATHRKRNSIIREAIKEWITRHVQKKWSKDFKDFKGIEDFPTIEELRKNLIEPKRDFF